MTRWIWTGSSEGKMFRFDLVYNDRTELGVHAQSTPALNVEIARRVMPWCIKILPDPGNKHNIAVGDSDGALSLWDGAMGTRIQHLKHHGADIVSMCTDPSGETIYCASVDAGVSMYTRSKRGNAQNQWVYVGIGRQHTHDVQAVIGNKTHLFSAGIDTTVYTRGYGANMTNPGTPLTQFGNRPVAQLFGGNRILVQLHDALQVWRLGSALTVMDEEDDESDSEDGIDPELVDAMQPADGDDDPDAMDTDKKSKKRQRGWRAKLAKTNKRPKRDESQAETHDVAQPRALLLELKPQLRHNNYIACSAVSRNGDRIAMSDFETTRVFYLKRGVGAGEADSTTSADEDAVGASEDYMAVRGRKTLPGASISMRISEAGQLLRATADHQVEVYDLRSNPVLLGSFDFAGDLAKDVSAGPIVNMAVSSDAQWLAVGDANNNILIYNLDTLKFHGALPLHDVRHTCLSFQPGESHLAVGFVGNKILMYDIEQMQLTQWSKRFASKMPVEFSAVKDDQIFDIAFHPEQPHFMTAYSHNAIFVIDLSKPINKKAKKVAEKNDASDEIDEDFGLLEDGKSWRIIQRYHPLLFSGFAEGGSLVVVERPFRSILLMLPPPFYRHRFAT
jgi:WD40 repeat protein